MGSLTRQSLLLVHMVRTDSYTPPSTSRYECTGCLSRFESETHLVECPECGERVRNVAVPRE